MEDPAFTARLKADPKAALAELLKAELPPELTVHVFQETSTDLLLRLPPVENDEMSEKELEGLAGGIKVGSWGAIKRPGIDRDRWGRHVPPWGRLAPR